MFAVQILNCTLNESVCVDNNHDSVDIIITRCTFSGTRVCPYYFFQTVITVSSDARWRSATWQFLKSALSPAPPPTPKFPLVIDKWMD